MTIMMRMINIRGFRCFGSQVTIPDLSSFNVIGGPISSGKSSIVDALLFVIGTKYDNMTATERKSLIFEGDTPATKATVELVLAIKEAMSNEMSEVHLSRTVTADTDYCYINDTLSTRKDIDQYLRSSGFSNNHPFVVQQDKIDELANASDKDRLDLLKQLFIALHHAEMKAVTPKQSNLALKGAETPTKRVSKQGKVASPYVRPRRSLNSPMKNQVDRRSGTSLKRSLNAIAFNTSNQSFVEFINNMATVFAHTFQKLFPKGMAELYLVEKAARNSEPGVMNFSGLGIRANFRDTCPDGMLNIMALSGSEKLLVAWVLILSTYFFKPMPLYIFDAIDDPLDNDKKTLVYSVIKSLSAHSQILLTVQDNVNISFCDRAFNVSLENEVASVTAITVNDRREIGDGSF
uniref:SMC_N domain-containing protein n=1 Tax=Panagrellus redivivus TaxID=6233 RepID=A0A7E4VQJ0_PANRE